MPLQSPSRRRRPSASTQRSNRTKYSIDFDALRGPDSDASSLPDLPQNTQLDAIRSEDIDGPTDFTQNLEYWMRAPLVPRFRTERVKVTEPVKLTDETMAEDLEEYIDSDEQDDMDPNSANTSSAALAQPSPASRKSQGATAVQDDRRASGSSYELLENQEKVLSFLETLPDAEIPSIHIKSPGQSLQTPAPARKARSLQPTVEDYDGTPTPRKSVSTDTLVHELKNSDSSDTISKLREQSLRITQLQDQLKQLQAESSTKIKELEKSLKSAERQLKVSQEEKARQTHEITALKSNQAQSDQLSSKFENRVAELERALSSAHEELDHYKKSNVDLRAEVESLKSRPTSAQPEAESKYKDAIQTARDLKLELAGSRSLLHQVHSTHRQALQSLQAQLADAQSQLQNKAVNVASLEIIRAEHERELNRVKEDYESRARSYQEQIRSLSDQLNDVQDDADDQLEAVRVKHQQEMDAEKSRSTAKIESLEEEIMNLHDKALEERDHESSMWINEGAQSQDSGDGDAEDLASLRQLRSRLRSAEENLDSARESLAAKEREITSLAEQRKHVNELYTLSQTKIADLESGMSGLRQQLEQARSELSDTRQEINQAKVNSRMINDELEEYRKEARARARGSEDEIRNMRAESEQKDSKLREALRKLSILEDDQRDQVEDMRKKAEDAVRKMAELLESEKSDKVKARKDARTLKEQLKLLRSQLDEQSGKAQTPLGSSEDVVALKKEVEALKLAARTARAEADAARKENKALREDQEMINKAMDDRILEVVQEREKKWAQRVEALVKDSTKLKRALMHEWGREECGLGDPQPYKYKYVKR